MFSTTQSVCVCTQSLQSCLTLCDPMDCGLPGSSVHESLQPRTLEWFAISFSRGFFQARDQSHISCVSRTAGGFFVAEPPGKPAHVCVYICMFCVVLSHSVMSYSVTPWTVAHQVPLFLGILQPRILEWVTMPSARGSSQPRTAPRSRTAGGFLTL